MSVYITKPVWESTIDGSVNRLVALALADAANQAGYCYPSIGRVARMTGLSESSVKRAIRHLEALGVLVRVARFTRSGDRTSNGYRFDKARLTELAAAPVESEDDEDPMADLFRQGEVGSDGPHPSGQRDPTPRPERPPNHQENHHV